MKRLLPNHCSHTPGAGGVTRKGYEMGRAPSESLVREMECLSCGALHGSYFSGLTRLSKHLTGVPAYLRLYFGHGGGSRLSGGDIRLLDR